MNWLFAAARSTGRNRLVLATLVALITVIGLASQAQYLREYFSGPARVSAADLLALHSVQQAPRRWVRLEVPAGSLHATGLQEITVRTKRGVERGRSVSATYHAAVINQHGLLVKVAGEEPPSGLLVGELVPMEDGVASSLFKGESAGMRDAFLPFELHVHDYRSSGHWILAAAVGALLFAAVFASSGRRWMNSPDQHPAVAKCKAWGDLRALAQELETVAQFGTKLAGWRLGDRYLVRHALLALEVHALDELLWVYFEVTKKKLYFVIPAGQTTALVFKWRDATVRVAVDENEAAGAVAALAENYPWVIYGWSKETQQMYEKQRGNFAVFVRKAREQALREQQEARAMAPTQPAALAA